MTHTYSTTNIVILAATGQIGAEDYSHPTDDEGRGSPLYSRAGAFIDREHMRVFSGDDDQFPMHEFTLWLHEMGAVVEQCWILPAELRDEERQP